MISNDGIAVYNLGFNQLGDEGVATIAEALKQTFHIVCLNLEMNDL